MRPCLLPRLHLLKQPAKTLQAARRSCVPGSKATRCPAGSLSSRQHEATLVLACSLLWTLCCCAASSSSSEGSSTMPTKPVPRRTSASPEVWRAPFMFRRKTSHILSAYTSHKARFAAAGAASVPALQRSRRDAPSSGTPDLPRLPALRDRRPHASGSQAPPPAARVHVSLAGLSASRVPSLLVRG